VVHGVILVGAAERMDFEGVGWRSHTWGRDLVEPVQAVRGANEAVRQRAPLMAAGRPVEYLLVTSEDGAAWRARDRDS
jgi:hypothetical protein